LNNSAQPYVAGSYVGSPSHTSANGSSSVTQQSSADSSQVYYCAGPVNITINPPLQDGPVQGHSQNLHEMDVASWSHSQARLRGSIDNWSTSQRPGSTVGTSHGYLTTVAGSPAERWHKHSASTQPSITTSQLPPRVPSVAGSTNYLSPTPATQSPHIHSPSMLSGLNTDLQGTILGRALTLQQTIRRGIPWLTHLLTSRSLLLASREALGRLPLFTMKRSFFWSARVPFTAIILYSIRCSNVALTL
jgi:hypothetical protein